MGDVSPDTPGGAAGRAADASAGTRTAPASAADLAALLAECSAAHRPVLPVGAGTWLRTVQDSGALEVATSRLDTIVEHEPADLVIGVQAGVTLERLRRHLADHGQWLPLDPAAADGATIGAVVANASAGPLRALHGTPADLVLGLEVATGDGRLLRFGGRVVKNVAGYDGVRLLTGSRGALGIITAVYLRVRGLPPADRTWALRPAGAVAASPGADGAAGGQAAQTGAALALAVRDRVGCDALELLAPHTAAALGLAGAWTVLARVTGGDAAVDEASRRIADAAAAAGAQADPLDVARAEKVWAALCSIEAGAADHRVVAGLPSQTAELMAAVTSTSATEHAAAHAADGVIRVWSSAARPASGSTETCGMEAAGAHSPADLIATRLAAAFDPAGILVPGRRLRGEAASV
jgi:glycolate oxidase FAD binding subunit